MSETSGTIESIKIKQSETGNDYFTLKLKEVQTIFTCFNIELAKSIFENDYAKLEYTSKEKDGRTYYNIMNITVLKEGPKIEENISRFENAFKEGKPDIKETMRQCFKDAKEIFSSEFGEAGPEEITSVAISLFIQRMKR